MRDVNDVAPGLKNAGSPLEGVATAGQPSEEQLRHLAEAGFKTVVDLRMPREDRGFVEPEVAREAGMEYVNIPLDSGDPASFIDEAFDRFRELMADRTRRPVLVHCASATRVGALMVPYLVLDEGKSPGEAVKTARGIGPEKEELTARALEYAEDRRRRG